MRDVSVESGCVSLCGNRANASVALTFSMPDRAVDEFDRLRLEFFARAFKKSLASASGFPSGSRKSTCRFS